MTQGVVLELRSVTHDVLDGSQPRRVLSDVDLTLGEADFVAVSGPSGAGKSTLLRIAAGLIRPTAGTVLFRGTDISREREAVRSRLRRREIGFVFQDNNLLPMLSALENVSLALELDGMAARRARSLAGEALEQVGVGHLATSFPDRMSGGECQRVAIARAIVGDRTLVLADEPTGALDSANGDRAISVLQDLCVGLGKTVLLVTHNEDHAKRASRTVNIVDGVLRR